MVKSIENGTINPDNIAQKYKMKLKELNEVINGEWKNKRKPIQYEMDRLIEQIKYWEELGTYNTTNNYYTWKEYAEGYDAAAEWLKANQGSWISGDTRTLIMGVIKDRKGKIELSKYQEYNNYWIGYGDFLERLYKSCEENKSSFSPSKYITDHMDIVSKINKNEVTLKNINELIETAKRERTLYKKNEAIAMEIRLQIQKYILNADSYLETHNQLKNKYFWN